MFYAGGGCVVRTHSQIDNHPDLPDLNVPLIDDLRQLATGAAELTGRTNSIWSAVARYGLLTSQA
jgi:hypothetical protein